MQLLNLIKDKLWPYGYYFLLLFLSAFVVSVILVHPEIEKLLLIGYILAASILTIVGFNYRDYVVETLVFPFLLVTILMPPLQLSPQLPHIRLEVYILSLLILHIMVRKIFNWDYNGLKTNRMIIWFAFFGISIIASTIYSYFMLDQALIVRDLYEIIKIIIYLLFFSLFATLHFSQKQLIHIYGLVTTLFLISALIGFAQYLDIGKLNELFSVHYAPTQAQGILGQNRITGTAYSPVEYGAIMVLAASLSLSNAFFFSKRCWNIFSWCSFFIFTLALIMTQTRAAYIAYLVAVSIIILYGFIKGLKSKQEIKKLLLATLIFSAILIIAVIIVPEDFFERVLWMLDLSSDPSWQPRLVNWQSHINLWKASPLLGWGPDKTALTYNYVENEWLMVLRRYGLLGIVTFLCIWLAFIIGLTRIRRNNNTEETTFYSISLQSAIVGYFFYMITLNLYHSMILIYIILILLGIVFSRDLRGKKQLDVSRVDEK